MSGYALDMVLPSRPADAPIPVKFFSGAAHITDNRLRTYLNELEAQVDALLGGPLVMVVDDVLGSDDVSQDGSAASPLATIVEAERRAALFPEFEIDILVKPHGGAGYVWPTFRPRIFLGGKSIWVRFTEFTELVTPSAAGASSSVSQVDISALFIVADALNGKTVEILTGASAGDRRTILRNTSTIIEPVAEFSAAVAETDLFRVIEPDPGNIVLPTDNVPMVTGVGVSEAAPLQDGDFVPGIRLVNAIIVPPTELDLCADARFLMFGCEVDEPDTFSRVHGSGQILMGRTAWNVVGAPASEGVADTAWVGWGVHWPGGFPIWTSTVGFVSGYIVAKQYVVFTGFHDVSGHVTAGSVRCIGSINAHDSRPPRLSFGDQLPGMAAPVRRPSRVNQTTGGSFAAFECQNNGLVIVGKGTIIDSAGICIRARAARVRVISDVTLNTGTVGLNADRAGELLILSTGTITVGTISGNEVEVGNTPATGTIASLAAAGAFLKDAVADDNSIVHTL